MAGFEHIYTPEQRAAEVKKRTTLYKRVMGLAGKQKRDAGQQVRVAERLVEQAAFLAVMLDELDALMLRDGCVEMYQNGANQKGTKKTVAADLLDRYTKTYSTVTRQLIDLLPDDSQRTSAADILDFQARRPT